MNRFDSLPSVTLDTLSAQLYPDETLVLSQDGVGLYDGKDKSPLHYEGRLHLTSHRLVFVSTASDAIPAAALPLALVRQTEYWTGFLKSSPKITLLLHPSEPPPTPTPIADSAAPALSSADRSWVCRVCGMKNVPTLELGLKCSLCGVPNDLPPAPASSPSPLAPPAPASTSLDPVETGSRITCPTCTFLNHHSMARCEMCDTPLPSFPSAAATRTRPRRPSTPSTAASSRPSTPSLALAPAAGGGGGDYVRLSFRRGGIQPFYAALKDCLGKKQWQLGSANVPVARAVERTKGMTTTEGASSPLHKSSSGVGIDAILRGIDLNTQTRTDSLDDALKDLESLMKKAKEMIQVAQSINARLSASTTAAAGGGGGGGDPAAAKNAAASKLASTSLSSFGLLSSVAVTADQSRSDLEYHHSLARELASLLQPRVAPHGSHGPTLIDARGGVIGLDELWCAWNRARGVALVSPSDLACAVAHLERYTDRPALRALTFPRSGLTILHTPTYSPDAFRDRLLRAIDRNGKDDDDVAEDKDEDEDDEREKGVGLLDVAQREGLSLGLTKEMIELVELDESGGSGGGGRRHYGEGIVRDAGPGGGTGEASQGVRWYRDWITGFEWDGQD
ncbi:hypothetical protein JCM11491_001272 [Sporobolomyces phaffii]